MIARDRRRRAARLRLLRRDLFRRGGARRAGAFPSSRRRCRRSRSIACCGASSTCSPPASCGWRRSMRSAATIRRLPPPRISTSGCACSKPAGRAAMWRSALVRYRRRAGSLSRQTGTLMRALVRVYRAAARRLGDTPEAAHRARAMAARIEREHGVGGGRRADPRRRRARGAARAARRRARGSARRAGGWRCR